MRKEIFFAIIAGGGLGLLIAFGIWRANSFLKPRNNDGTSTTVKNTENSNPSSADFKIVVASPFNLSVTNQTPIAVSGISKPKAFVVLSGEDSDTITNASDSGSFNGSAELTGGVNQILVDAYDADGSEAHTNLLMVYSSQFNAPSATEAATAQAYIGTVTDISNSVIQIKTDSGDIQQISGTENVNYVDTRGNATKQIKSTDIAIGDYLVAMGVKDGNNILSSSRILVTDALKKTTRATFFGVVTDDSQIGKITVKNPKSGKSITVTPADSFQITGATKFSGINKDDKVIVSGVLKDGNIDARTILVIPSTK